MSLKFRVSGSWRESTKQCRDVPWHVWEMEGSELNTESGRVLF
ncbi:hypothetical protein MC7420_6496 [Coleofasciculus chthonoplastes PCC 7420]|uniref:Uncharacterized protein n=1 Tax=Coleofasciculus chthonoplastes PCC 7420 TaxID=118168 RepID=B4VQE8_9CYAN|nr:hypothetical protein MC7420_6496 [Coleofasciculus chthonoplastes PCC 7420]